MDHHPVIEARDGGAAGAHAQAWNDGMDETGQGGDEQRAPEPQRMTLMLEIRLPNGSRVLQE